MKNQFQPHSEAQLTAFEDTWHWDLYAAKTYHELVTNASAGFYHSPNWNKDYPRVQILTIEDLLAGAAVQMPPTARTYKRAQKETRHENTQQPLL